MTNRTLRLVMRPAHSRLNRSMPVLGRAALTNRFPLLALRAFFGRPFPKRTLFPQNGYQGDGTDAASPPCIILGGLFANWLGQEQKSITAVTDATGNAIGVNGYDAYGIPNETNIGRFQYSLPEPCWEHGEVNPDMAA